MGPTKSIITSSYERIIIEILNNAGINYEREKSFDDLKKGYYRYDFYLPQQNIFIECDGEQHFHYVKKFHKKREDFLKGQERDRAKNAYALAHNIKLYRIPFFEMQNIKTYNDLFNDKFLVKSIFHNDRIKLK